MTPQVLKEYTRPGKPGEHDVLILLRPQTNNCYFESIILGVFRASPEYKKSLWLEYMANIPGGFIKSTGIMEQHYAYRLRFARQGKELMSDYMKSYFYNCFDVNVDDINLLGAYAAMEYLNMDALTMFKLKISNTDKARICGQNIIRYKDLTNQYVYIINPDIPALLTFNYSETNSAVIMFRTTLSYQEFNKLILDVLDRVSNELEDDYSETTIGCKTYLHDEDIEVLKGKQFFRHKRLFHFSHGPFEQILDGRDFLYRQNGSHIPLSDLSYTKYLLDRGLKLEHIQHLIENPIIKIQKHNAVQETSLFTYTRNMTYEKGWETYKRIKFE